MLLFQHFILSHFHYCSLVWFDCGKENSNKLERIPERALRVIYNDYKSSYYSLLERANILTVEICKSLHALSPGYIQDPFTIKRSNYNLGDATKLAVRTCNTTKHGLGSVCYLGTKLYNSLPPDIKQITKLGAYKKKATDGIVLGASVHPVNSLKNIFSPCSVPMTRRLTADCGMWWQR